MKKIEYLGCDIKFYKDFLEKTFKPGMNWDNHGDWEIDHIIPLQYKQDSIKPSLEEVAKRLHYTNTQCLWHTENLKKGNRYCGDYHSQLYRINYGVWDKAYPWFYPALSCHNAPLHEF